MKLWWSLLIVGIALPMMISVTNAETDLWEEDDHEVLVRTVRGAKDRGSKQDDKQCRYNKGQWSECDPKTNMRTRSLSLKRGDKTCEPTKVITKKCKKGKACRYEKGQWSNCINSSITRVDNLKMNSDPTCDKTRRMTKKCKPEANNKKAQKDRASKKANKQQ